MADKDVWDMSDSELDAAFEAAKAEETSPEDGLEPEIEEAQEEQVDDGVEVEEEVETLEHPEDEQDSDDDTSSDDDAEAEAEEDSTEDEVDPDGDNDEFEEEQTKEADEEVEKEEQPEVEIKKNTYKANGREYEFTDDEVKEQFGKVFGQAMNYTKKMQEMKPDRKKLDAIKEAGWTDQDVNLAIELLKGDKNAITELIKQKGIDTLELDVEGSNDYTPKDYGRDDKTLAVKDVIDTIKDDVEYDRTYNVISKEWDDASWKTMSEDPNMIALLHGDVKSGLFDKVQSIADKLKVYDGGRQSSLDYYGQAAREYAKQLREEDARLVKAEEANKAKEERIAEKAKIAEVKKNTKKAETVKKESAKRKAAAPTKKVTATRKSIDYLDDSDEAFEDWYKELEGRM